MHSNRRKFITESVAGALLTAPSPQDAWRSLLEPTEVVGLGRKSVGGVPANDVLANRFRTKFLESGFDKWPREGVRWPCGTDQIHPPQDHRDMSQVWELKAGSVTPVDCEHVQADHARDLVVF